MTSPEKTNLTIQNMPNINLYACATITAIQNLLQHSSQNATCTYDEIWCKYCVKTKGLLFKYEIKFYL